MGLWIVLGGVVIVPVLLLGLAIAFGGPRPAGDMGSITSPFRRVDFSGMPPREHFAARDGTRLAFRRYAPAGAATSTGAAAGSVVLVHGSSASSDSMHPLAAALARTGRTVLAVDVRGHGESGARGHIARVGQLEDDLEDLVAEVAPPHPRTLLGFSSGGGFVLRFAGGDRQELFDRYLLLSPYLAPQAPTTRPGSGGWVTVGVPRIVAITILDRMGVKAFDDLPVMAFALGDAAAKLTPTYSYALATNFRPHDDYRSDIRQARRPMEVLAGTEDEAFFPERFAQAFADAGRPTKVTLVPGVGHVGLTVEPAGIDAVVVAITGTQGHPAAGGTP